MGKFLKWIGKFAALIIGVSLGAALLGVPWVLFLQKTYGEDTSLTIITRLPLEIWSLIAGLIVIAVLLRFDGATLSDAYFRRSGFLFHPFAGGVMGVVAAGLGAMLLLLGGHVALNTDFTMVSVKSIFLLSTSVFLNALLQEMMFRGYFLFVSKRAYGVAFAIIVSSLGFVLVHGEVYSGADGVVAGASLLLGGLGMAFMVLATRSIWLAAGYHWGWNMAQSFLSEGVTNKAYAEGAPLIVETGDRAGVNFEQAASGLVGPALIAVIAFAYWRRSQSQNRGFPQNRD
jgi:membrane protease YdiL (CAAX protease family)